jgi:uncharacterized protein YeaO (DUF488 family)
MLFSRRPVVQLPSPDSGPARAKGRLVKGKAMAELAIKRVYDGAAPGDGQRVLVDRIWPRGLRKEEAAVTVWLRDVAPSTALRQWFGHEPAKWDEFRQRYNKELAANPAVAELRAIVAKGKTTLLFAARDTEHNNAVVIKLFLASARGKAEPRKAKDDALKGGKSSAKPRKRAP